MSKDVNKIKIECCKIWNGLKDKTKMINYLIESKQRIAELEQENESYQKLIDDICNKHRVANLKELDEIIQATNESLYASREYLEDLKSDKWKLEEQLKNSRVKYFIGFDSDFNIAVKELDLNIVLPNWMHDKEFKFYATKEEAQEKLKELFLGEKE